MRKSRAFPSAIKKLAPGKFLAGATTDDQRILLLTTSGISVVSDPAATPALELHRPWHEVSNGAWDGEAESFTISWVDGGTDLILALPDAPKEIPITFKEYVERSIVVARTKKVDGVTTLRVAIRKNEKGEMFTQTTILAAKKPHEEYAEEATALEQEVLELIGR